GELEAEQELVLSVLTMATHHVPQVGLGEVVVRQVDTTVARCDQIGMEAPSLLSGTDLDTHEDLRFFPRGKPVIELRDLAIAEHLAQPQKGAWALWDGDREHSLTPGAELRALGHVAQSIEVD